MDWRSFLLLLLLFLFVPLSVTAFPQVPCHRFDCSQLGVSWVCGSDGRDYLNFCELERMRCFGLPVRVQAKGRCKTTMYGDEQRVKRLRVAEQKEAIKPQPPNRSGCSMREWREFLSSMVRLWHSDFVHDLGRNGNAVLSEDRIVERNFDRLDVNHDRLVSAYEWKVDTFSLQKTPNGPCVRDFMRRCDRDSDRAISRLEWAKCWAKRKKALASVVPKDATIKTTTQSSVVMPPPAADCDLRPSGNRSLDRFAYSRECPSGRSKRPQAGCSHEKNTQFLQLLFTRFRMEMLAKGRTPSGGMKATRRQAAQWKFEDLDKNGDKLLQPAEWRKYRAFLRTWPTPKCGRLHFRLCDANGDRRIDGNEWMKCTVEAYERATVIPRMDRNPLLYLLRPGG